MNQEAIIKYLLCRDLNCKNNNTIFTDLDKRSKDEILKIVKNNELTVSNFELLDDYYKPKTNKLTNVLVDLSCVPISDILNYSLSYLGILDSRKITLNGTRSLLKFQSSLFKNDKAVQFILYNKSMEDINTQKYISDMFRFNSYLFVVNALFEKNETLSTFATSDGQMLDNREDYIEVYFKKY